VSDKELPNYEKRGSFTIHSYQGKTIETGNVWIFIDDLFEYAMLYTAVSRAVNFSQIKFVRAKDL
jgi:ATP-dependent exoDNAse (exonuclease V) alpha subunit